MRPARGDSPWPPSANRAEPRKGGPSGLAFGTLLFSSLEPKHLQICISKNSLAQVLELSINHQNIKDMNYGIGTIFATKRLFIICEGLFVIFSPFERRKINYQPPSIKDHRARKHDTSFYMTNKWHYVLLIVSLGWATQRLHQGFILERPLLAYYISFINIDLPS